jgi:predicted phage gp36 major capsid-like protein
MWHLRLRLVERHAEFGQAGFLAFPRLGTHPLAQNAVKAY